MYKDFLGCSNSPLNTPLGVTKDANLRCVSAITPSWAIISYSIWVSTTGLPTNAFTLSCSFVPAVWSWVSFAFDFAKLSCTSFNFLFASGIGSDILSVYPSISA